MPIHTVPARTFNTSCESMAVRALLDHEPDRTLGECLLQDIVVLEGRFCSRGQTPGEEIRYQRIHLR